LPGLLSGRLAALCDEMPLPFADRVLRRILVVHGLEGADATRPLLRQLCACSRRKPLGC